MNVDFLLHQAKAFVSEKQEIFLAGGIGAGKTTFGSVWLIHKCLNTPQGVQGLVVANTYSQLFDTTVRAIYDRLNEMGVMVYPKSRPRSRMPFEMVIDVGSHGVPVLMRSLDHYENLSGLEVGWYWADEVWQTKRDAIDLLNGRLRDRRMPLRQALFTTTLDDPDSWMYERFVENYNPELQEVVYAKTIDNPFLPPGYLDSLKQTYPDRLFERMCNSAWVTLDADQIYYSFEREGNVSETADYDRNLPVLWAHDWNIGYGKPMSSCLVQQKNSCFTVFDEIILDRADTNDVVQEFQNKYPKIRSRDVTIYGDASGNARDTRSKTTDYEILRKAGFTKQRVPKANPSIRDRHNTVNALLCNQAGERRVLIHPRCKTLIKGLETVHLKKGAGYLEDDSQREQHVTTAIGYLLFQEAPLTTRNVRQRRVGGL